MFLLYYILIGLGVLFILLLLFIATRPNTFTVHRSAVVSVPPERVFPQINDFHNWQAWSPWAKLDPNSLITYEGAPSGKGAIFTWKGNKKVGEGRMTILDSQPPRYVELKLEFIKPFPNTCTTVFAFDPTSTGTKVSWTMSGKKNFMSKAFCLFVNMDKMIGGDFEKGLAAIKTVVESQS